MIPTDVSKQQGLDADQKAIKQIDFTGNLDQDGNTFSIIEEAKEAILDFSQRTMKVLLIYFALI